MREAAKLIRTPFFIKQALKFLAAAVLLYYLDYKLRKIRKIKAVKSFTNQNCSIIMIENFTNEYYK